MIKRIFSNELAVGSFILFILFNLFNFLNFVFRISMARMLGPADYSVLAVLMTFLYFTTIPSDSIQLIVSKYTSKFKAHNESGKIKYFLIKIYKTVRYSFILYILLIPFFVIASYFLDISLFLFLLMGLMVIPIFLLPANKGALQGLKRFKSLGFNMATEGFSKLIIAILFVFIGLKVYGAVTGIIIGTMFSFFVSMIFLKDIFEKKQEKADTSKVYEHSSPIIYILIAIMLFQSIDIILAKNFFSDIIAGQYAVASDIGKMLYFGTIAVSRAMFPIISEKFENGAKTKNTFLKSIMLVFLICLAVLSFLLIFPDLIIKILYGNGYLGISHVVLNVAVAFTFLSLSNIVLLYSTSVNKKIELKYVILFIILQIFILWMMKSSVYLFSIGMILSSLILFFGSILIAKRK